MFKDAPDDYRSPFWSNLAGLMERKHGLPSGLLVGILTKGERSNASAVSSAGAKTPFQIIPETRAAIEKKYGIDPYLNPRNAAEGAALLLKESLQRNKGDARAAVAEYHGGTNRENWGPGNRAYVQRVMGGGETTLAARREAAGKTTEARKPPLAIRIQSALSGKDGPEARAKMIEDLRAARVIAPPGMAIPAEVNAPREVDAADVEAYNSGRMPSDERARLAIAVEDGLVKLPKGAALSYEPKGLIGGLVEAVTGRDRATAETDALQDWGAMPELNQLSMASAKTGLGTMMTAPQETVEIIRANFPGVQIRQDARGNFIMRSSIDGREYAIKPGFQPSDIPRTAGAVAAFMPAGRATSVLGAGVASAATQAAIETSQAATGGEFNPGDVAMAGAMGAAVPLAGRVLEAAKPGVTRVVNAVRGRPAQVAGMVDNIPPAAAPVAPAVSPAAVARAIPEVPPAPVAPVAPAVSLADDVAAAVRANADDAARAATKGAAQSADDLTGEQMVDLVKVAAGRGAEARKAQEQLAQVIKINPQAQAEAAKLGIELPVDVFSDNVQFVNVSGLVRSAAGSADEAAWQTAVRNGADKADEALATLDATSDIAEVSDRVLNKLTGTIADLKKQATALRTEVDDAVPKASRVDARATRSLLKKTADELGGEAAMTAQERNLLKMLDEEGGPTYARLIRERQAIGDALERKETHWSSVGEKVLKRLYGALADDQLAHVESIGGQALRDKQRASNTLYSKMFGLQKRVATAFGKEVDGSIAQKLQSAISSARKGDVAALRKVLKAVPDDMKREAVASALFAVVRDAKGQFGFTQFAKTYRGLRQNGPVYAEVVKALGPGSHELLNSLYTVSERVARAQGAVIYTGKANQALIARMGAESLTQKILGGITDRGMAVAAQAVAPGPAGGMLGEAVRTAVASGKPQAMRGAAKVLNSPEFAALAETAARGEVPTAAVKKFALTSAFGDYLKAIGAPRDMSSRERFVMAGLQAGNNLEPGTRVPEEE